MKTLLLPGVFLVAAYAASPYVSLYEMGRALRHGDVSVLAAEVDWSQVRSGLKEEIASGIAGQPAPEPVSQDSDDLPPFGAGMLSGMAENIVDRVVTPERLSQSVSAMREAGAHLGARLVDAYFVGPTRFEVAFRTPQQQPGDPPIALRLELEPAGWGATWKVVHAAIPLSLLNRIDSSAS